MPRDLHAADGSQRGPLVMGGEKAVGPVGGAGLRVGNVGEDNEARQIGILGAEPVTDPRADPGIAAETVAGIHVEVGGRVIDRLPLAAAIDAKFIHDVGKVLEMLTHPETGLADLAEVERRTDIAALAAGHVRRERIVVGEELAVELIEFWFGIERIDVARTTFHVKKDAVLRLGGEMTLLGRKRISTIFGLRFVRNH